ncbi:UNVERIFIED_CONTAM: 3,9-dihydroxypterocarpan 6A-monooxygenase [Sesamum radiatum]|uniref:3,9-dihydroxypterocarpan 6A-monooxygenase n=1 Tax=Sesamum radiatum TaxID=300843 RepID=A0AAW2TJ33_SESRA
MAEIQEYMIFLLIWLIPTILLRVFVKKRSSPRLPPSPLALPIIGHLHLLSPIPHQAFFKISSRYGPLIHLYLGSVPCVVASSPEICKEFLKTHEISFLNRPKTVVSDYVTYGSQDLSFAPYGDQWKFVKKLCISRLLGGQTLDLLQPIRRQEINYLIELLSMKAKAGESVAIGSVLTRLSNNVISTMALNRRLSGDENEAAEMKELVQEITALTGKLNLSDFIWFFKNLDVQGIGKRLKAVMGRFDKMMEKIIEEHQSERRKLKQRSKEGEVAKDVLHILLDIAEDESSEMKLTRENIKGFILNRVVQESDIPNLPYLQAIVKESLRIHPSGPIILRESTEDCTISGYHIPAKTQLFVNVWAVGRDPNHWENPLEFRPERFLAEDGSSKGQLDVRGQHYQLLPFGSGRRSCPGNSLALLVVQTALAAMIQCFDWKVEGSVDMEEAPSMTLPRANPLICFPLPRLNPIPSL